MSVIEVQPTPNRTVQQLFDLTGRVAIVTGGAGLLGKQFSQALVEAGASVVIASRTLETCSVWAEELTVYARALDIWQDRSSTTVALPLSLDVTQPESARTLVQSTLDHFGRLDILVNNAYSRGVPAPPEELTPESWQTWIDAGLSGLFYCAQAAAIPMLAQGSGSIINIASMYGVVGVDVRIYPSGMPVNASAAYGAVKGGVINLTRSLAVVWAAQGVRVNCISPGGFPGTHINGEFAENFIESVPLQRMGNRNDLKGAVVFLASDAGAYVIGHNLLVDGGWTAW
ncbi:SDR family oxidoreductase [bacterium]|nr:SDR family oxidoreductase [bacterium]